MTVDAQTAPAELAAPTIPLNKLKFGDDRPGGSINARTDKRTDGLDELGASILAHGIILPLAIETIDSIPYVSDGNRRLRAMRMLVGKKKLPKDYPVKVSQLDPDTGALEASLAANMFRLPLHELDQFEAFAKLAEQNMAIGDIASHFGTSERHVRQRMALGNLCPEVRAAWRDGKMPRDAAEAFTISTDHTLQAEVYRSLARGQNLYRHAVLRALTGGSSVNGKALTLVGRDAYAAAGGRLVDDLFGDDVHILDGELLARLTRERLQAECDRLLAEGWSWASIRSEISEPWRCRQIDIEPDFTPDEESRLEDLQLLVDQPWQGLSDEERAAKRKAETEHKAITVDAHLRTVMASHKAETGCLVDCNYDGKIEITYGLLRPDEAQTRAPAPAVEDRDPDETSDETPEAGISAALSQTLSEQRTLAAAKAIERNPPLALAIAVATLQTAQAPARLSSHGMLGLADHFKVGSAQSIAEVRDFGKTLGRLVELPVMKLIIELAPLVARSLDLTDKTRDNPGVAVRNQGALVDALPGEDYLEAARAVFDPADFFYRAPARVAIDAMVEMTGGNPCKSKKKADLAKAATELVQQAGWLPPQLRCASYAAAAPAPAAAHPPHKRGRPAAQAAAE